MLGTLLPPCPSSLVARQHQRRASEDPAPPRGRRVASTFAACAHAPTRAPTHPLCTRLQVHVSGSLHPSGDELMRAVTGAALDPGVFLGYLRRKYAALYGLEGV